MAVAVSSPAKRRAAGRMKGPDQIGAFCHLFDIRRAVSRRLRPFICGAHARFRLRGRLMRFPIHERVGALRVRANPVPGRALGGTPDCYREARARL